MRTGLLTILLFAAMQVSAQQARVTRYQAPLAGTAVMSEIDDKYAATVFNLEAPNVDGNADKARLRAIKQEIAARYPHKRLSKGLAKSTQAAMPVVLNSFVADSFPGIPPDNYMAISQGYKAVSVMNTFIAVLDPVTQQMVQRKSLSGFTQAVGLPQNIQNPNNYKYDPKIIYDPEADRYIAVVLNGVNQFNWVIFGFSQTNDPAAGWNFYKLYGDYAADTTWFDYPTIALTHNEFFLSGNKITYSGSWQAGFRQSVIYQVRKEDGYAGAPNLTYQLWDSIGINNNMFIRNLFPVKGGGVIHGPEQYFLSNRNFDIQNDTILLLKIPDTIGSTNNTMSLTVLQSNLPYGVPPDGRQDSSYNVNLGRLTTNDGRILGAYIENDEIQFVSASLNTGTGSSGVYHGRIANVSTAPAVTANIYAIDTIDFGYPNISFAGNQGGNTSIISFDYTGPRTFAGLGAIYFDGSQYSDLLKVKQGDSIIEVMSGLQRWGDYTGSQPFWSAIGRVWIEGIYGRKDRKYGNYMAEIGVPALAGVGSTNHQASQGTLYPNPAYDFIELDFSVAENGPVNFTVYDMSGRVVDQVLHTECRKGKNRLQFNTAPFAQGNYILKGMNVRGETILAEKFTRQ